MMIPARDQLPDDAADWTNLVLDLPSIEDDSATCPFSDEEIMEYIRKESGDLDRARAEQLRPLRTARVADMLFWIWRFVESDGTNCFVTVFCSPEVPGDLQIAETNGLSAEQFILACFYDEVYWS